MSVPDHMFTIPEDVGRHFRLEENNDLWFDYAPPENPADRGRTDHRRAGYEKHLRFCIIERVHVTRAARVDGKAYEVLLVLFDTDRIKLEEGLVEGPITIDDYYFQRLAACDNAPNQLIEELRPLNGQYPDLQAWQQVVNENLSIESLEYEDTILQATQTGYLWSIYADRPLGRSEVPDLTGDETGINVVTLQTWLGMAGREYDPGVRHGHLDEATKTMVRKFEADTGIGEYSDVVVSRRTWYKIEQVLKTRLPPDPYCVEFLPFPRKSECDTEKDYCQVLAEGLRSFGFPMTPDVSELGKAIKLFKALVRGRHRFEDMSGKEIFQNLVSPDLEETSFDAAAWAHFSTTWGAFYGAPWMGIVLVPGDTIDPNENNWGVFETIRLLHEWGRRYLDSSSDSAELLERLENPIVIRHISKPLGGRMENQPDFSHTGTEVALSEDFEHSFLVKALAVLSSTNSDGRILLSDAGVVQALPSESRQMATQHNSYAKYRGTRIQLLTTNISTLQPPATEPKIKSIEWDLSRSGQPGIRQLFHMVASTSGSPGVVALPVLGVAFQDTDVNDKEIHAQLRLKLEHKSAGNRNRSVKVSFENTLEANSGKQPFEKTFKFSKKDDTTLWARVTYQELDMILKGLRKNGYEAALHRTFLRAFIPANGDQRRVETQIPAYPTLQHSLFFLPGVFGTQIRVRVKGRVIEAFPEFTAFNPQHQELLACKRDGEPMWEASDASDDLVVLEEVAHWEDVYKLSTIKKILDAPASTYPFIVTRKDSDRQYSRIVFTPLPYDWRRDISKSYMTIAQDIKNKNERLAEDRDHPFLSRKVSLAGHSTGGVIMRGILSLKNPLKNLVSNAFFITVPFRGAPKAEYVFLTGQMGMDDVAKPETLRQMACDMPIVYYLSPYYPENVWSPAMRKRRVDEAIKKFCYDPARRKMAEWSDADYEQAGLLRFNDKLAEFAKSYYDNCCKANRDVKARAYIFYSQGHAETITGIECLDRMFVIDDPNEVKTLEPLLNSEEFKLYNFGTSGERYDTIKDVLGGKDPRSLGAANVTRLGETGDGWLLVVLLPDDTYKNIMIKKQNASLYVYNPIVKPITEKDDPAIKTKGDATVPYDSQVPKDIFLRTGGWRNLQKPAIPIDGNPVHAKAANSETMWERIRQIIYSA